MNLDEYSWTVSDWVKEKLAERGISLGEVEEAVYNSMPPYLIETRKEHKTRPATRWFISQTANERLLKVAFILYEEQRLAVIKTAYEPEDYEVANYEEY